MNIDGTKVLGARWLAVHGRGHDRGRLDSRRVANSNAQTGTIRSGRGFGFGTFANRARWRIVADVQVNMKTGKIFVKHLCDRTEQRDHDQPVARHEPDERRGDPGSLAGDVGGGDAGTSSGCTSLDWVTYPILRFTDAPAVTLINVHPGQYTTVVPGDMTANVSAGNTAAFNEGWLLSGSGEPPTSAVGSAVANAFFDATGVRIRQSPMNPANVRGALRNAGVLA